MRNAAMFALIALCLLFGFAHTTFAQTTTVSVDGKSKYVVSAGSELYDKPVLQTDVTTSWVLSKGTFTTDFWWSMPSSDAGFATDNFGNEVDFLLGYSMPVGKCTFSVSGGLYSLSPQNKLADDYWTVMSSVGRSFAFGDDSLSVDGGAQYYFGAGHDSYGDGMNYYVSLGGSVKMGQHGHFNPSLKVTYDDGLAGAPSGLIGKLKVGFAWDVGGCSIGFAEEAYTPLAGAADREVEWVSGISFSRTFGGKS